MTDELLVCAFGAKTGPIKETSGDRTARIEREAQAGLDARAIRLRRKMLAKGREASSLFGGNESSSLLGAGL